VAGLGAWRPTLTALRAATSLWPGFALLRDGQQFIAPLALAESIGIGAGIAALLAMRVATPRAGDNQDADRPSSKPGARRADADNSARGAAITIGVLAVVASVVLLPGLSWGAVGRLRAVEYPADWLTARRLIETSQQNGSVLLLPWAQYRAYSWNNGQPVFDPWPRLLARTMIWNDALRVGSTTIAAESRSARRLGPVIDSGRPRTAALRAAGVRFVVVDAGPLLGRPRSRLPEMAGLPGAQVLLASPDLIVFTLSG